MHYVFRSRADADLIMMGPVGDQLLRIIGREPAARGIIEAAALPAAIRRSRRRWRPTGASTPRTTRREEDAKEPRVGLAQRAWPLLEMMKRASADKTDIVWGV